MGVPEKRLRFRRRASEHCQLGLTDTWLTASDRRGLTVWEVVARGVAVMIRHCGSDVFGSIRLHKLGRVLLLASDQEFVVGL
jgi:hypothetical protein